jgi:hypothetical protein
MIWQAASVLPGVSGVLETLPRADAQPVRFARPARQIINRKSEIENGMVRLPGIAPGHARWQGAILLLNHNREIKRAGSVIAFPARAISIKNKHLLLACATNPRFHGGCFGV